MSWRTHTSRLTTGSRLYVLVFIAVTLCSTGPLPAPLPHHPRQEAPGRRYGGGGVAAALTTSRKRELREIVRTTFYHGFDNYMKHAFPQDELKPLSCQGLGHDRNNLANHEVNDVLGDYSLTLVDSLSTLAILGDRSTFTKAMHLTLKHVNFDVDSRVQVFEVTIRMLGGLLSAHLYAVGEDIKGWQGIKGYKGELLTLAQDLGRRLLPAFTASPTGIPYSRVNLRSGVMKGETHETCSAAAGSLVLEFATLSRLTGDPVYEAVARKAFFGIWHRRSSLGLFGNTINVSTGVWMYPVSSIGAGIDSMYEYMAKAYVLLGEDEYLRVWDEAYGSVMKHMRSPEGFWYRGVNMMTGGVTSVSVDSLSAFWPGLQVLVGDVESAVQSHVVYANLWKRYSGIPEVFDIQRREASSLGYPLRPEFIESNYFLYRATQDSWYLDVAERVIHDIVNRTWVDCGLAVVENLETGRLEDRMHSFALSETLMYLYLTFDETNPINHDDSAMVFTTEGHPLFIPSSKVKPKRRRRLQDGKKAPTCPIFSPLENRKYRHELKLTIEGRSDVEFARGLTGYVPNELQMKETGAWSIDGFSEVPVVEDLLLELAFASPDGTFDDVASDTKVKVSKFGIEVLKLQGLKLAIQARSDSQGFDIRRVAQYRIPSGGIVFLSDPMAVAALGGGPQQDPRTLLLKVTASSVLLDEPVSGQYQVMKASFGPDISTLFSTSRTTMLVVNAPVNNSFLCQPLLEPQMVKDCIVMVKRGVCDFKRKAVVAGEAGAKGVLVITDDEDLVVPTASSSSDDVEEVEVLVPLILARNSTGRELETLWKLGLPDSTKQSHAALLLPRNEDEQVVEIRVQVVEVERESTVVVINGYKLINVQLLMKPLN